MKSKRHRRPSLIRAQKRVDAMPDSFFGDGEFDMSSLPCLTRSKKEKITANFDAELLERVRDFARRHKVSYTNVMNDILRKAFGLP